MSMKRFHLIVAVVLSVCLSISVGAATVGSEPACSIAGFVGYSHPLGLEFQHPKAWRVWESPQGLQVVPPDAGSNAYGPTEAYIFTLLGAAGITSLDDPRAAQHLQSMVAEMMPFLRPSGDSRAIGKAGRVFTWKGISPQGLDVECLVYGKLAQGYFLGLIAIGDVQAVNRRQAEVVQIFESLRLGEPKVNSQLAGTWYTSSYSSAGTVSNRTNVATHESMTLLPNGRVQSSAQTAYSGRTGDGGQNQSSAIFDGLTDASKEEGRWAVSGSDLYLLWKSGGVAKYSHYVQGNPGRREMLLTPPGQGEKVLWTEYP
jgi:hypothetical protein